MPEQIRSRGGVADTAFSERPAVEDEPESQLSLDNAALFADGEGGLRLPVRSPEEPTEPEEPVEAAHAVDDAVTVCRG